MNELHTITSSCKLRSSEFVKYFNLALSGQKIIAIGLIKRVETD